MNEKMDSPEKKSLYRETQKNKVDEILKTMSYEVDGKDRAYTIKFGSKSLDVLFDFSTNEVLTYIENVDFDLRRAGETTLLYMAAKKIMENVSSETGEILKYSLTTTFESMRAWADEKGREIFDWDEQSEEDDFKDANRPVRYNFLKIFNPSGKK